MGLRHFVSAGVVHYYLPASARLDWLTATLRRLDGAAVAEGGGWPRSPSPWIGAGSG